MAGLEAEVFLEGKWKNYDDLESNISLPELLLTLETLRKRDYENKKFAAALKGVNIDEEMDDPIEKIRRKLAAKSKGGDVDHSDILADPNFGINRDGGILYETI